jgi:transcriptional regulator with XRE-family HTH domain
MRMIKDYVTEYKEKKGISSYAKTMESLGIQRAAWTKIKNGGGVSDETAVKIAEVLKIDPLEIIATSKVFASPNQEVRKVWVKLANQITSK